MHSIREYSFRGKPYKVSCIEPSPQHPSWFTYEDESSVRDAQWDIQPGDCVFDVGAAYGSYTLTALSQGASRVFAWSPQGPPGEPTEREFFAESLALNGWSDKCIIYGSGVYNRSGWLNTVTQTLSDVPPDPPNGDVIQVSLLDEWFQNVFVPNHGLEKFNRYWLKLDIEGAEVEVLQTSKALISMLKPHIQIENHNFKRASIEQEVREIILALGYREVMTTPYHSVSHSLYVPLPCEP